MASDNQGITPPHLRNLGNLPPDSRLEENMKWASKDKHKKICLEDKTLEEKLEEIVKEAFYDDRKVNLAALLQAIDNYIEGLIGEDELVRRWNDGTPAAGDETKEARNQLRNEIRALKEKK